MASLIYANIGKRDCNNYLCGGTCFAYMRKFRMSGVKNTPKVLEKELLDNAKKMLEDPSILIPKCAGEECRKCRFGKIEKKIAKVKRHEGDQEKLVKLAFKGDQFVRAYAATISLAAAGKVPFLSSSQLPSGEVSFAVRGTVDKEKLIGLQHFNDPDLRLLAYWDMARKYDLHIYSTEKGLFCSAEGAKAPAEYVKEMLGSIDYKIMSGSCGHIGTSYLIVKWGSAGQDIRVCKACAGDNNLVVDLSARIAAPEHSDDFDINANIQFHCAKPDCGLCKTKDSFAELVQCYKKGEMGDRMFLTEAESIHRQKLRQQGGVFVAGDDCFGDDRKAFLAAVKGSDLEREVLSKFLNSKQIFVVSDSNQAGKMITELWKENKKELLAMAASEEIVAQLKDRDDLAPPLLLAEARRMELAKGVDCALPAYKKLGELGRLADSLARAYKTEGKDALMRIAEKVKGKDHRNRSICYAFMRAAGEPSRSWQFSKQEADFGEYLEQFAKEMLTSCGKEYDDGLHNLITASGANETIG
jgi:hypothetical protein